MNQMTVKATHKDVWERRFASEGRLWGDEASSPAKYFTRSVLQGNGARILEIGAGYGRDSNWFAENGHKVTAVDRAANALTVATSDLLDKIGSRDVIYVAADFRDASIGAKSQDAFFSHRVLHLLGNNGVVEAFATLAARSLKTEGRLLVTARSFDDFKPLQMDWIDEAAGVAKYKEDVAELGDRRGQTLYFWNEEKLRNLFENDFDDISIVNGQEIESVGNVDDDGLPIMTNYVSISARRKYTPS